MDIKIPKGERSLIRVFAVNRASADIAQDILDRGEQPVATELLGLTLPQDGFELFPTADLTGVGLTAYLVDGYAVPKDQLNIARSRLDALEGYVLLVFSAAFEEREATLTPGPDLTLIGTYGEAQPDMTALALESTSAAAYSGTPRQTPAALPKKSPRGSLMVAISIVLVGLACWWALS